MNNDPLDGLDLTSPTVKRAKRLAMLGLPADLTGKRVLDVGCGDGFFSAAALARGASEVIGIDRDPDAIAQASSLAQGCRFVLGDWADLPPGPFDIMMFLSGLDLVERPRRLMAAFLRELSSDGLLIVECSAFNDGAAAEWRLAERGGAINRYPTFRLLLDDIFGEYSARILGPSANGPDDQVPRYVIHCRPKVPTLLAISGRSGQGKSSIARLFGTHGIKTIHTDSFIEQYFHKSKLGNRFLDLVGEFEDPDRNIRDIIKEAVQRGFVDDYCHLVLALVSLDDDLTVVEGVAFTLEPYRAAIQRLGHDAGFRVVFADL